ncbi:MAG: Ig-like domain-containing protein [Gemmatimonadaceae bacterium]|nr:Ig-like domain-containing protein [Gemmatimonadaceae bacterium]
MGPLRLRTHTAMVLMALSACEPDRALYQAPNPTAASQVSSIEETTVRTALGIGDSLRLTMPSDTRRDRLVTWTSSAPAVATVSKTGLLVGRALGESMVIGSSRSGTRRVQVRVVPDSVLLPPDTTRTDTTVTPPPPPPSGALGLNAALGRRLFPDNNPWNQPVDTAQVDPNSAAIIANIGATRAFHPDFGANWNGGPFGIPYVVVSGTQARVPVSFEYADESDPGPYPVPPNPPIEGGPASTGDRHILVVDRDNWKLYELYAAYPQGSGWRAGSGAIFDLNSNALRPAGWTSADAAGLPILPGLVRYEEVAAGTIAHAMRFTVSRTRRAYIPPARHWASSDTSSLRPPMGMRVRLKASVDISTYPASAQVILRALKKYGMIVADNGSDWYVSGTADARWNDGEMNTLKRLRGSDFEVVRMQGVVRP